jgi:SAM-dependent methyltransferase
MPQTEWATYYERKTQPALYPEGFVVRAFLSNFPEPLLEDREYAGKRILDISCGYGRNLGLLLDLGFEVHATEVSPEVVAKTGSQFPQVQMRVGRNGRLPYEDGTFDFLLACNTCYYLEPRLTFADNLAEIARVLRPGGSFVGSMPGPDHFIFVGGEPLPDGSVVVRADRDGLRNGDRLQRACGQGSVAGHLRERFYKWRIGHLVDDACGQVRDLYYFTAVRR